jgi:AbrB family looped-hinge helix DNA binding protein
MLTSRVDAKGRVSIPADVREALGIQTGDVLFLEIDSKREVIQFTKPKVVSTGVYTLNGGRFKKTGPGDVLPEGAEMVEQES